MGIQYLYKWISTFHKHSIEQTFQSYYHNLCIDITGLIHYATQYVYRYGKFKQYPKLFLKENESYSLVIYTIQRMIQTFIRLSNPSKRIIFVMDGVSPGTKRLTQRTRRFSNKKVSQFNINQISVGTIFIDRISNDIYEYLLTLVPSTELQIYFSDYRTPGESEYKIIQYIQDHIELQERILIISRDSDIILLSLSLLHSNLYILRYNEYHTTNIINIHTLKQTISDELPIDDFYLLTVLSMTNDYNLAIPFSSFTISKLIMAYKHYYTMYSLPIIKINRICTYSFYLFIQLLYFSNNTTIYNENEYEQMLKSFHWGWDYFGNKRINSWIWANPYPSMSFSMYFLSKYLDKYNDFFERITWSPSIPNTPFEQLIQILPLIDSNLLPIHLRLFIINNNINQIPMYDKEYYEFLCSSLSLKDRLRNFHIYPLQMDKRSLKNRCFFLKK